MTTGPNDPPPDGLSSASLPDATTTVPLSVRMAHEIPVPKDWQSLQRGCVLLFKGELGDPHVLEYGRDGQGQSGIDLIGRRDGKADLWVGIQCRRIQKPIKESKILADCEAALELEQGLKELIFATTAPNDTGATDAAARVEKKLRADGHDMKVVVYGWGEMQNRIALHDDVYRYFMPSIVASQAPVSTQSLLDQDEIAERIASKISERMLARPAVLPTESERSSRVAEDPVLHARIDAYRDLHTKERRPDLAEKGLIGLLETTDLSAKPWARFRIETNLASAALELGKESEAAEHFEAAYGLYPEDSLAISNLSLARLVQHRYAESMELARRALAATPRADNAVGYLLQAAGRSDWQGDPSSLIAPDLVGTKEADIGLAEFYRRREAPGWEERVIDICARHQDVEEFKRLRSTAVLALAVGSEDILAGGFGQVTQSQLNEATDDLKALAEHYLDVGFTDRRDLVAFLNNAGVLLRLAGRHGECADLMERGLPHVANEPSIRRLLALARIAEGRRDAAKSALSGATDPESILIAAELLADDDLQAATDRAFTIVIPEDDDRLTRIKWTLAGDLALRLKDAKRVKLAAETLKALPGRAALGAAFEARAGALLGLREEEIKERLRSAALALNPDAPVTDRVQLADEMLDHDMAVEAVALVEGRVDLSRINLAAMVYLRSLVNAGRDAAFAAALASAGVSLRESPPMLWLQAAHAWNTGDLRTGLDALSLLLKQEPRNARARLLRLEMLIRLDRSDEVLTELGSPIEELNWRQESDRARVAQLLGLFGFVERAMAFAYRTFLKHRDQSNSWRAILAVMLREGQGKRERIKNWDMGLVGENAAVDLEYETGGAGFIVVEPDAKLRSLDSSALEPSHPDVQAIMGKAVNGKVELQAGRKAKITRIRHKYVARFHDVMERYEERFPDSPAIKRVNVDVDAPGGLDELLGLMKDINERKTRAVEIYRDGPLPLPLLASAVGVDTIDASGGLAAQGISLKVAVGMADERGRARRAIEQNHRKGCVLDLLALWTVWQLKSLKVIVAECGPVHVPQTVLDRLRARREQLAESRETGLRLGRYEEGKLALQDVPAEVIRVWQANIDDLMKWVRQNAVVCPLVMSDELPEEFRALRLKDGYDFTDCILVAFEKRLLLISDDLPTRQLANSLPGVGATWQHELYFFAADHQRLESGTYASWTAQLIEAGHSYLSISGYVIAAALRHDVEAGEAPGRYLKAVARMLGGKAADPASHVRVVMHGIREIWADPDLESVAKAATGQLLRAVTRERHADSARILAAIFYGVRSVSALRIYIVRWMRGHFVLEQVKAVLNEVAASASGTGALNQTAPPPPTAP